MTPDTNPNPWHRYGKNEYRRKLDGGWELRYLDDPTWTLDVEAATDRIAMLDALHPLPPKTITLEGMPFARDDGEWVNPDGDALYGNSPVSWQELCLAAALDKIAEHGGWDTNDE